MEKDYRRLWGRVANAPKKAEAVRALTGIVSDIQGRAFVFSLESEATKTCIEILDLVSRGLCLPISLPQMISLGHHRAQPQIRRKAGLLLYIEETC